MSGADVPTCETCGQRHVREGRVPSGDRRELPTCGGHVTTDRASYVKGQDRKKLDQPRPCGRWRPKDAGPDWKCTMHGAGAPQVKAAAQRNAAEAKAEAAIIAKLGDSGQPITDPIATLCSIAGRAVKFMELIGDQVDTLTQLRIAGEKANEIRAEIALYERSMGRAATVVESLIRMGIAERLAKVEEEQTAAIVKFIDGVLTDLGHNPRAPEVAGVVARRLELVS